MDAIDSILVAKEDPDDPLIDKPLFMPEEQLELLLSVSCLSSNRPMDRASGAEPDLLNRGDALLSLSKKEERRLWLTKESLEE